MKKLFSLTLLTIIALSAWSQAKPVKKPVAKPVTKPASATTAAKPKPVAAPPTLKTLSDSASYAIGLNTFLSAKQQNMTKLNSKLVSQGMNDVQTAQKTLFDEMTAYNLLGRYINQLQEEKAKPGVKGAVTKAVAKPAAKPVTGPLKTTLDSVNYAIGMNTALFARQQGINNINTALLSRCIDDMQKGQQPVFSDAVAYQVMNEYITDLQEEKALPQIKEGEAFLAQNKLRPGVITTASGLQYEIVKDSTGIQPTAIDTFVVHYRGTLLNGTEFDASYNRNEPLKMPMNRVISGWTEGLQLMHVGAKYKFWIPYTIAYGPFDNGAIPGGATLVFDIELLDVKKAAK